LSNNPITNCRGVTLYGFIRSINKNIFQKLRKFILWQCLSQKQFLIYCLTKKIQCVGHCHINKIKYLRNLNVIFKRWFWKVSNLWIIVYFRILRFHWFQEYHKNILEYVMSFCIRKTWKVKLFIYHRNKLGRIMVKYNFNV